MKPVFHVAVKTILTDAGSDGHHLGDLRVLPATDLYDEGGYTVGSLNAMLLTTSVDVSAPGDEVRMSRLDFVLSRDPVEPGAGPDQVIVTGSGYYPGDHSTIAVGAVLVRPIAGGSGGLYTYRLPWEAGVAVAPGIAFGEYGEGYVRIGLVENRQRIRQAARNVKAFLTRYDKVLEAYYTKVSQGKPVPFDALPPKLQYAKTIADNMREQLRLSPVHASRTWRFTAEAIVLQALTVPSQPVAVA